MTSKPKRRWFQFSLKTLIALMTVAGFGLGYVGYERRLAQQQLAAEGELTRHGVKLLGFKKDYRPRWLMWILGDDSAGCKKLVLVRPGLAASPQAAMDQVIASLKHLPRANSLIIEETQLDDKGLANFRGLTHLQYVWINKTQVTDAGLAELRDLKTLKQLNVMGTRVGDPGLQEISRHQDLETLGLGGTKITDAGLHELRTLKKLASLNLANTQVTDKGLEELQEFPALQELVISGTQVTDTGVRKLQRALPKLMICHESLPQNKESPIFGSP